MRNKYRVVILGIFFVVLDQITKFIILKYHLLAVELNKGGAFSIGQNYSIYNIFSFIILAILLSFFTYLLIASKDKNPFLIPMTLIISGGISNIIDRFYKNGVVDYIDIKIWPSFNLADIFIFSGFLILVYRSFFRR